MGRIVAVTCPRCGGSGKEDSGEYDNEGRPIEKFCSKCDGAETVHYYVDEDGHYSESF